MNGRGATDGWMNGAEPWGISKAEMHGTARHGTPKIGDSSDDDDDVWVHITQE